MMVLAVVRDGPQFPCESFGIWYREGNIYFYPKGKSRPLPSRRCGFNAWLGKIPWRRKWQLAPVFLLGESHGQKSLAGYSPWGCKDTTEMTQQGHTHTSPDVLVARIVSHTTPKTITSINNLLGWPKSAFRFFIRWYRKIRTNFMATLIY